MKTAATGSLCYFDTKTGENDSSGKVRLPAIIQPQKSKKSVRVVLEMDDYEIMSWLSEFQQVAESRAKAHENMAARLRAAVSP